MLDSEAARRAALAQSLASVDAAIKTKAEKDKLQLERAVVKAKGDLEKFKNEETSMVGLEKPLFELKNPGLISVPLGFLAVILGSLLYRDQRAEEMWDELYVRQNTGILAAKAAAH